MRPVYASKFLSKLNEQEQETAKVGGIVPINDAFFPYWDSLFRHEVYYGGRGSGKSKFIAQKLVHKCVRDKYFRWQYSRKHQVDIKDSQYELLKQTVSEFGLWKDFNFNETTMKVTHRKGNAFIAKGMDDPERKGKGTVDLSGFWGEEITEFEQADLVGVNQNLRTKKGPLQSIVSFNPIHEEHWVRKYYFTPEDPHKIKPAFPSAAAIRTTLYHNSFINQEQYAQELIAGACGNQNILRVVLEGDWGLTENGNPWLYSLNAKKHFNDNIRFLPTFPIIVSFDFNNDPFACTIRQASPRMGDRDSFWHYIDEVVGQYKIEDTCQIIKARYPSSIIYVTGDRSGENDDLGRNQTLYQMLAGLLGINYKNQVITSPSNLLHSESRLLTNVMFEHYPNFYIGPKCVELRKDCEKATVDGDNRLPSHLKKDREYYKMDAFDGMRYDLQNFANEWAKKVYSKILKK